jgi:hypothetical protein
MGVRCLSPPLRDGGPRGVQLRSGAWLGAPNVSRGAVALMASLACAGCASSGGGVSARVAASTGIVVRTAEEVLRAYAMPVEARVARADDTRVRTLSFLPGDLWTEEEVAKRVTCEDRAGTDSQADPSTWLQVTVSIRDQPARPLGPVDSVRFPISTFTVSSAGGFSGKPGRCRISESFAEELAIGIASRLGALRTPVP